MPTPPPADSRHIDLRAVAGTLRGGQATEAWLSSWLPLSYASPELFTEVMYGHLGARRGVFIKNKPADGYDLYHEHVLAHQGKRRTALLVPQGASWEPVTYETLHVRSNALMAAWRERGVEPKATLAAVLPPGLDQAVCLLTAFRMGLVVSLVPPFGPSYVRLALERLAPAWTATTGKLRGLLGAAGASALPADAGSRTTGASGSFTYPPGAVAARLLTPFGEAKNGIAKVTAQVLLDGSLRDASLIYNLDPDDILAAPGFEPLQHEPSLLLAALVAGATRAYVTDADLDIEPELLAQLGVTVLGLHRKVRDGLLERRASLPPSVRRWFRSLTDVIDGERWDAFWSAMPTRKTPGFGVVSNSASGGTCLFSPPSVAAPNLRVYPAPGLDWRLSEMAASEVLALNDMGAFTVLRGGEPDPSLLRAIVGRWGEGYAYAGPLDMGPDAHPYPSADIERVVEELPEVRHASAFSAPGRWVNEAKVVLLLFTERELCDRLPIPRVEEHIRREMGAHLVPHRIEVLPLRPRIVDGVVDRAWCRTQYLTGAFSRKARSEAFVLLGRLGYIFAARRPGQ